MGELLVVVGVDGSPASYTALLWTLAEAGRTGARVRAVRCWTPILAKRWEAAVTTQPVPPIVEQEARAKRELAQVMAAALARMPHGATPVAVQHSVVRGPAGSGLVSQTAGADLLVVGHSHRSIEMLHRSVSWYCARHATCPVLVIPPAMATRRTLIPDRGGTRGTAAPARVPPSSRALVVRTVASGRRVAVGEGFTGSSRRTLPAVSPRPKRGCRPSRVRSELPRSGLVSCLCERRRLEGLWAASPFQALQAQIPDEGPAR
ncbi:MAG: universal stress protein [Pseudonocardiaceae bacterium]